MKEMGKLEMPIPHEMVILDWLKNGVTIKAVGTIMRGLANLRNRGLIIAVDKKYVITERGQKLLMHYQRLIPLLNRINELYKKPDT